MTSKYEYKEALGRLDRDTRVCFKYLEKLIIDKFNACLGAQQTLPPRGDFSRLERMDESLQKQIDGLRPKVEAGYTLAQEHEETEKYLVELAKSVEAILDEMKIHFGQLYKSGYYKEGERRKIREQGILEELKSDWEYKVRKSK